MTNPEKPPAAETPLESWRQRAIALCKRRGWSLGLGERYYKHGLEVAELAEALRGKKGDPVAEAGDAIFTLMAMIPESIALADVERVNIEKIARLMEAPPYAGEDRTPPPPPPSAPETRRLICTCDTYGCDCAVHYPTPPAPTTATVEELTRERDRLRTDLANGEGGWAERVRLEASYTRRAEAEAAALREERDRIQKFYDVHLAFCGSALPVTQNPVPKIEKGCWVIGEHGEEAKTWILGVCDLCIEEGLAQDPRK